MALKTLCLLRFTNANISTVSKLGLLPMSRIKYSSVPVKKQSKEENLIFSDDPDVFGTLSRRNTVFNQDTKDEDDFREEKLLEQRPLPSQKLTIKQYADLIKQYLNHKRLKKAIEVLEVRMLTEDRVKPENYIYNILIGACAEVGYTKKAFSLYNDMKRRALSATGDTYTCLFNACSNSPWASDGLKRAKHLREFMSEKGIEPNLTNYNSMIKAFGRCGDLSTAFQIVDEMRNKNIDIRVHTFNFLLQSCISDKERGLRHALIVWRHMLRLREKPNIYSFNLMLKCVKECNIGNKDDMVNLINTIENMKIPSKPNNIQLIENAAVIKLENALESNSQDTVINKEMIPFQKPKSVPNLLSINPQLQQVLSLQEITKPQDKFKVVGGIEEFLKQMSLYSVKPDIKTFTQMLFLIEDTEEDENKLLDILQKCEIKTDIDFYNMLIKKRCLRQDYKGAFAVRDIIEAENKLRKKKHPMKKKLRLKLNIMTYGVLAMACDTKEKATQLIEEMKEKGLKMNAEILGTLLKQGIYNNNFGYVLLIMNIAKNEKFQINDTFLSHLEQFDEKCSKQMESSKECSEIFTKAYTIFRMSYKKWLKETNIDEVLNKEHPWKQFQEDVPEPFQREFTIEEPKKFYKRNRKFQPYIVK